MKCDISLRSARYVHQLYGFGTSTVRGFSHRLGRLLPAGAG
jgi:hypothetical protein